MTGERPSFCPDPALLTAYLDGQATHAERTEVERHMADCDDCRELMADAVRLRDEHPKGKLLFLGSRRVRAIGGGVLALAASLILVVQVRPDLNPLRRPTPYDELVAAAGPTRAVEGRLTAFPHARLRAVTRSGDSPDSEDYELLAAAAKVRARASDEPTPENLRALGVAQLALGRYDDAVGTLEKAAGQAQVAGASSDLAAAYLERGRRTNNAEDYAKAVAAAERAIRADPSLAEAYFNRALALEYMRLDEAAAKAWQDAIARDPSGGWADEARERVRRRRDSSRMSRDDFLQAVRGSAWDRVEPVLARDAQLPREVIEDELLREWAEFVVGGRTEDAAQALGLAAALSARTVARHPDPLLAATVARIDAARPGADAVALARGHLAYAAGRAALRQNRDSDAARLFESAADSFARAASPFRLWADFHRALTAYYQRDLDRARSMTIALDPMSAARGFGALYGRTRWLLGLLAMTSGRYGDALVHYGEALAAFERHGDREHRAAVSYLLAEVHMNLGDGRAAWARLVEALGLREDIRDPWRRHTLLLMGGVIANRAGLFEAALPFQEILVEEAVRRGDAAAQTEAYLQRAVTYGHLGARAAALGDIEAAYASSRSVPDAASRGQFETDVMLADGEVRLTLRDASAVQPLDAAVARLQQDRFDSRVARLLLARARARLLTQDAGGAEADLAQGIALVERLRGGLARTSARIRYTDRVWDLYAEMAALQLRHGRPDRAQEYIDRARARSVVDALGGAGTAASAVTGDTLRRLVGPDAALVSYVVIDSTVGVWVGAGSTAAWTRLPVSAADLRAAVRAYLESLQTGSEEECRTRAASLYDVLLAPIRAATDGARRLVVVPHDALYELPFGTLFDRRSGTYVVERHSIVVAPGLLALARLDERRARTRRLESVLAVGDPAIPARHGLPRLTHAAEEAALVAQTYQAGLVLAGADATVPRILREIAGRDVLHFAGHAVASAHMPELSRLLVAASPGHDDGAIYARDLRELRLRQLQLAVLSACRTAAGPTFRGEGAVTIASAFLAAGVPRVIGTYWDVPDEASSHVSAVLHRELASGAEYDVALRAAQLSLLSQTDRALSSPAAWGAFQAFGITESELERT